MSKRGNPRRPRVAQLMRDVLSELLEREVRDPRVHGAGLVSVNHVELNRDMSVARVFVSFYGAGAAEVEQAMAGLAASTGFLRGPVARKMRLRRAPELRFVHDTGLEFGHRLSEIVRQDAARAHADDPDRGEPADVPHVTADADADVPDVTADAMGGGRAGGDERAD